MYTIQEAEEPVCRQMFARLGSPVAKFVANYEGDTTTGARRVSSRTVSRARTALAGSRARTVAGRRRVLGNEGVLRGTQLQRTIPARQLTGAQVRTRTAARAVRRNAGTGEGRLRTAGVLATARAQARGRRRR